ncbi:MAG: putative branched-chain amino acid transport system ATP-binding protein [Fibrobacteria bacterium]|nr:putative branched-chain amino acid transport system ATP-binding protein [Fibrobacteria bacterium]
MADVLQVSALNVYYGESRILRDVDIRVEPGRITALMGRNGVGKTTLLKSIIGLLPARSGAVALGDRNLTGLAPELRARAGIAYVPQGREIFPKLTVEENLAMGLEARPGPRPKKIPKEEVYDLFPFIAKMEKRLGGNLSGGQQQQLAIARALLGKPKVLLLDEPTEGIQPSIVEDIGRVLEGLKAQGDLAILLVEQFLEFAKSLADTYTILDRGAVVEAGPISALDDEAARRYLAF